MTDDVRKLLGGYATGTLTEAERQQLFSAALDDHALFEALADEQALADLLEDPSARAALLHAAENPAFSPAAVLRDWFSRPKSKVLAALGCIAITGILVQATRDRLQTPAQSIAHAPIATAPEARPAPDEKLMARNAPATERATSPYDPRPSTAESPRREKQVPPPPPAPSALPSAPLVTEVPQAKGAAVTPPPAAAVEVADAESATRSVTAGGLELQYTLLRRTPAGDHVPVPASFPFAATDHVRLRIQSNQDGTFEVRRNGSPMYTGAATAGTPILIPADLAFDEVAVHSVTVRFAQMPSADSGPRVQFRSTAPAAAARVASRPANSVSVHIVVRRAAE